MQITNEAISSMVSHALDHRPIEACGYIAGDGKIATTIIPLTNADAAVDHYSLDPREQFDAMRKMRNNGLKIMAVYHSHPNSPARMSEEDIRLAHDPNIGYAIISLAGNTVVKLFRVRDKIVEEELLEILTHGDTNEQ